jgi:uncharacterized protein (DUF2345 family)
MDHAGNISVTAPKDITITAGANISMTAGQNITSSVAINISESTGVDKSTSVGMMINTFVQRNSMMNVIGNLTETITGNVDIHKKTTLLTAKRACNPPVTMRLLDLLKKKPT